MHSLLLLLPRFRHRPIPRPFIASTPRRCQTAATLWIDAPFSCVCSRPCIASAANTSRCRPIPFSAGEQRTYKRDRSLCRVYIRYCRATLTRKVIPTMPVFVPLSRVQKLELSMILLDFDRPSKRMLAGSNPAGIASRSKRQGSYGSNRWVTEGGRWTSCKSLSSSWPTRSASGS